MRMLKAKVDLQRVQRMQRHDQPMDGCTMPSMTFASHSHAVAVANLLKVDEKVFVLSDYRDMFYSQRKPRAL